MGKMHNLAVGCADCTVLESNSFTFLVDCHDIAANSHYLPKNKFLKGVFITHQHYDHFDGLDFLLKGGYRIEFLICSPYERRDGDNSVQSQEWQDFNYYRERLEAYGTRTYRPFRQDALDKAWWEIDGIQFHILGPARHIATSETRELHDACLVIYAKMNGLQCLFTGDASDTNLRYIASNTSNFCNGVLHASHHGSINGADLDFIKACNAEYTVISTEQGVHESVPHPTALQRYHDHTRQRVYRTDIDGSLLWKW